MSNAFTISNLEYCYPHGKTPAIQGLSVQIRQGEFVCLVGPNGSGKTTLVKLMAGIYKPSSGTLESAAEFNPLVFQNPENQFISNIVEEDVAFGPENLCLSPEIIRKTVDETLECVGMYKEKNSSVSSLSAGEKQRVAIAGALALSSQCLILDEPASMINRESSNIIFNYVKKLNKEKGTTVICITQDPDLLFYSDSVIVLDSGRLVAKVSTDVFLRDFEKYGNLGIELSEVQKLIKLLNENGFDIKVGNYSPTRLVEEIQKRC